MIFNNWDISLLKMTVKWIVTTLVYVQMMFCFLHKSDDGVTIKYSVNFENVCWSEEGRFAILYELSIGQCVQECGLRKHCKALSFHSRSNVCKLFLSENGTDVHQGDCINVMSKNIAVVQKPCKDCIYGEVCDTTIKQCVNKECINLVPLNHGTILGNMRNVGSKIRFKCNDGYRLGNGIKVAECTASGAWTATAECVIHVQNVDCGQPAGISNGSVYAPVTTHGATATYTCDEEYQITVGNAVRICTDGLWGGTTPVCSPIPNVGCYFDGQTHVFVGTRQTTVNGRICQRWDSQDPHNHRWTSPDMFPFGDVSASENYCRDPERYGKPWCYTIDPNVRWELCGVPLC